MTPEKWKKMSVVNQLRSGKGLWIDSEHDIVHPEWTMREAATRIEELEAENARYCYALRAIANLEVWPDNLMSDKDIARAALEEKGDE